jgi:hypothetical protein
MVFITLVVGIIPAFNNTTETESKSDSESPTNDSDRCHEIFAPFLAHMLVAEANVLEKALSAGLNPPSQWHCTARWSILWLDCSCMQLSVTSSGLSLVLG